MTLKIRAQLLESSYTFKLVLKIFLTFFMHFHNGSWSLAWGEICLAKYYFFLLFYIIVVLDITHVLPSTDSFLADPLGCAVTLTQHLHQQFEVSVRPIRSHQMLSKWQTHTNWEIVVSISEFDCLFIGSKSM